MSGKSRNGLPEYTDTAEMREALRRASKQLSAKKRMSYREQQEAVADEVTVSPDVVNDFAAGNTQRFNDDRFLPALWGMIAGLHPITLAETWRAVRTERLVGRDPVTNALHDFWLPGRALNRDRLTAIGGFYAAYIPFFYDPSKVMVMALDCGFEGDDPGRFRLAMAYRDNGRRDREDFVEGAIIPYEENIMFVGGITEKVAPYIFALTNFPMTNNLIEQGEGALLAAARATLPTASPILIWRQKELPTPRVISGPEAAALPEGEVIEQVMARGNVGWR